MPSFTTFMAIILKGLGWLFFIITISAWIIALVEYDYYLKLFLWPVLCWGAFYLSDLFKEL